jgi:hypothetical protein
MHSFYKLLLRTILKYKIQVSIKKKIQLIIVLLSIHYLIFEPLSIKNTDTSSMIFFKTFLYL